MATNGNMLAISFKNTNIAAPTDYGTVIGIATYDFTTKQNKPMMTLHLFSYQPTYKGGDNSFATCNKLLNN